MKSNFSNIYDKLSTLNENVKVLADVKLHEELKLMSQHQQLNTIAMIIEKYLEDNGLHVVVCTKDSQPGDIIIYLKDCSKKDEVKKSAEAAFELMGVKADKVEDIFSDKFGNKDCFIIYGDLSYDEENLDNADLVEKYGDAWIEKTFIKDALKYLNEYGFYDLYGPRSGREAQADVILQEFPKYMEKQESGKAFGREIEAINMADEDGYSITRIQVK